MDRVEPARQVAVARHREARAPHARDQREQGAEARNGGARPHDRRRPGGAGPLDRTDGRHGGMGDGDHLCAGSDAGGSQRQLDGVRPARRADRVFDADIRRETGLERIQLGTEYVRAAPQHPDDRGFDFGPEELIRGQEAVEWDSSGKFHCYPARPSGRDRAPFHAKARVSYPAVWPGPPTWTTP